MTHFSFRKHMATHTLKKQFGIIPLAIRQSLLVYTPSSPLDTSGTLRGALTTMRQPAKPNIGFTLSLEFENVVSTSKALKSNE